MKKFKASFVKKNEKNWNDLSWKRKEKGDFRVLKFEKRTAVKNFTDFFACPSVLIKHLIRYK